MLVSLIKHGLLSHPFRDLQPVVTVNCSAALLCRVLQRSGKTDTWSFLFCCIILLSLSTWNLLSITLCTVLEGPVLLTRNPL